MTPTEALAMALRPYRPEVVTEANWVLMSWLQSYYDTSRSLRAEGEFARLRRRLYIQLYEPVVRDLIARSTIVVATLPEAEDAILGWMAVEGELLHYVHTKAMWRGLGVARFLTSGMRDMPAKYTHQAPPKASLPSGWVYDSDARFRKAAA